MQITLNAYNGSFACAGILTHTIETVLASAWSGPCAYAHTSRNTKERAIFALTSIPTSPCPCPLLHSARDPTTVTAATEPATIGLITLTGAAYSSGAGRYNVVFIRTAGHLDRTQSTAAPSRRVDGQRAPADGVGAGRLGYAQRQPPAEQWHRTSSIVCTAALCAATELTRGTTGWCGAAKTTTTTLALDQAQAVLLGRGCPLHVILHGCRLPRLADRQHRLLVARALVRCDHARTVTMANNAPG